MSCVFFVPSSWPGLLSNRMYMLYKHPTGMWAIDTFIIVCLSIYCFTEMKVTFRFSSHRRYHFHHSRSLGNCLHMKDIELNTSKAQKKRLLLLLLPRRRRRSSVPECGTERSLRLTLTCMYIGFTFSKQKNNESCLFSYWMSVSGRSINIIGFTRHMYI